MGVEMAGGGRKERVWRSMRPDHKERRGQARTESARLSGREGGKEGRGRTSISRLRHKVEHQRARDNVEERVGWHRSRDGPVHEVLFGDERVARVEIDGRVVDPRVGRKVGREQSADLEDAAEKEATSQAGRRRSETLGGK